MATRGAIFEAVHGTAPDIAGKGPRQSDRGDFVSGAMLLDYLGHPREAERIRAATGEVLRSGATLTRDLGGIATTQRMTDAVLEALNAQASSAADRA